MDDRKRQIDQFILDLENALNAHNAIEYNRYFTEDVSWVNPNGGFLKGLEELHDVHCGFMEGPLRSSRFKYTVEHVELLSPETAYVHCRLTRTTSDGSRVESDERCLYVLARKQDHWWLCAGHNTRIQPVKIAE